MPDRKWCHDVMRHARHGDASHKNPPRHKYTKRVRAPGVEQHYTRRNVRTTVLRDLHITPPTALLCFGAPPQPSTGCCKGCLSTERIKKTTDKTGSRMSPSSEDVSNQPHSLARQVEKSNNRWSARLSCEISRFTKRATPGPALLAFLPLRGLAAATLRERPVPLRLDESRPSCSPTRAASVADGLVMAWDRREHSTTSRQRNPHSLWVLPR